MAAFSALLAVCLGGVLLVTRFEKIAPTPPKAAAPTPAVAVPDLGPAPSSDPGYNLTPAEHQAVARFLQANPALRQAEDADARPSADAEDLSRLYGVYHPFFARGDVDDDGDLDFVMAFVDRGRTGGDAWFSIAVFRGDGRGGFLPAILLEREISLENGDLAIDRDSVVITPDLGQDLSRRYRWNVRSRRFDYVSDFDETEDDRPSNRI
jgi:hypothetical protein